MKRQIVDLSLLAALLLAPATVLAHTGAGSTAGFGSGFLHPIGGLDHLLAMIAVGLWAAQAGGRAIWTVPTAFVSVMILCGALGMAGIALPHVETGIVLSVLVLGVLIAVAVRLPVVAAAAIVGLFAVFHGHAHGAEMPLGAGAFAYSAGFALATALLHGAGIGLGMAIRRFSVEPLTRFAGVAIAVSGVWLAVA